MPRGITNMERFDLLPVLRDGVQVRYEGSIDKQGRNADWDWWLYRERDEWVIFDVDGPGCIYNFVQHRYPESREPTFRFYFDGEEAPRFEIKPSEFGSKAPFVAPLADAYLGPEDNGRGPIRVVRSFVPMPFAKSCRVTTDLRLKGPNKGDGGWGHIVYHAYDTADEVRTFTGTESYDRLLDMWRNVGSDPKPTAPSDAHAVERLELRPGESTTVLEERGPGSVEAIVAELAHAKPDDLMNVWIRATWDEHADADVECPIGVFFANELGIHPVGVLSHGRRPDGTFYHYFPMPYWRSARIELVNKGGEPVTFARWETRTTTARNALYEEGRTGYFRSTPYYRAKATHGADSVIGRIAGRGHLVAGHVTGVTRKPGLISCEGDVRVHIDGIATPQVESDGSESWVCYGWGFPTPPEMNPSSAYDGLPDNPWSMVRLCSGDWYPFQSELVFGIEAGEFNNQYIRHSGALFYYGVDEPGLTLTDELDIGDPASEGIHSYRTSGSRGYYTLESYYEGDDDHRSIRDTGHEIEGWSEFVATVHPENAGVRLRRRSDQMTGRQKANVYVDGALVTERSWYAADRNPYKRWLEDEFDVPAAYTSGKSEITIRLEYVQAGETRAWNEFYYWIYSLK
ncbi:DUF2961 domain-containing protein [Paenibacillus antri]|uniref:DUF2961 domain-containing protein n=1 Tax=Paenibacillus antri TaxID=2582848 RepID=A0A5R9G3Z0_9BACL|nr:DUF2961 domain-containing protein [Paenibacillus antri]TLS49026.1 DUF2961 domain-containing protein [Paenibacillus antri]